MIGRRPLGVEQVGIHVDVEDVGAAAHLLERYGQRALKVVGLDQAPEAGRARNVGALADDDEAGVFVDHERLETAQRRYLAPGRNRARRQATNGLGDSPNVLGSGSAAASDRVDEAVLGELPEEAARVGGLLVEGAELVREPRVWMAGGERRGDAREGLDDRPDLRSAERAVDADEERVSMLDRDVEGLDGLPREVAPAPVHGGEREPKRQLASLRAEDVVDRDKRCLGVQRVEDRLDHQQIDAALDQGLHLLEIAGPDLLESHGSIGRVFHPRREREGGLGGPDRADHEARLLGCSRRPLVADAAGEPSACEAHLGSEILESIIGLTERGRRESVAGDEIGARVEVGVVNIPNDIRSSQIEQVGIAGERPGMIAEALAAVGVLTAHAALNQHAVRPV